MQPLCSLARICDASQGASVSPLKLEITLVNARRLQERHLGAWRHLQNSNPELASPCFAPEFAQAVAAARPDVEVALISQGREWVAFFPFQRSGRSRAVPVGGITSDYQGIICRQDFTCNPKEILKACKLVAWDFDRLLASQDCFVPYHRLCEPSALIDLSQGYEAYVTERRAAGTHQVRQCEYLMRRLAREVGPIHFVAHSMDAKPLAQVLAWKSDQYRRSGWNDLFATPWGRGLIDRIHAIQKQEFAGMLSLLYAGTRLVAGHMGMRSRTVWHYWFPAYDQQFRKYSPGLILLLQMAAAAEELGLSCIDIGTGLSLYKKRLMNSWIDVAEGSVERPSCLSFLRSCRRTLKAAVRSVSRVERR